MNENKYVSPEEKLGERFEEFYEKVLALGGKQKVWGLFTDEMSFLLLDVCESIPHSPTIRSISHVDLVIASSIGDFKAVVYTFYYDPNSIAENALIFIVKTGDKDVRLFAVETHSGSYWLCEYYDNRHLNYGEVDPEKVAETIFEKIQNGR